MEGSAESEMSEDGSAILEVTDAACDADIFNKTTLEKEDSVPQKDESKADNLKVDNTEDTKDIRNKDNNEITVIKDNNNQNEKTKIKDCCENAKCKDVNENKNIKDNNGNNVDDQNSTIIQDFDNTAVKLAITTSTPYKQAENLKSKKVFKDLEERHLWIYNINPSASARKLKEDLSKFGNALVAKIVKNGGKYYGYALMENADCVQACIDNLHNKWVDGYRLELRSQAPNTRNQDEEMKTAGEDRNCKKETNGKESDKNLDRKESDSGNNEKILDKKGVESGKKEISPERNKIESSKKENNRKESNKKETSLERNKKNEESLERKERHSVTSLVRNEEFRTSRKRSRSSDPLTLKVKERKRSPETSENRLRRMELEMERMRQRERSRERQFERRMEREERTLFLKRQIETDRLKLNDEKRKFVDEKLKLSDDRRKLEDERQKLFIEKRKLEDGSRKDRAEIERLQRKLREFEVKLEDERRKRKRSRSPSKTRLHPRKTGLVTTNKENRVSLPQPRAVEERPDPWSSIDGKKYYKESELKRYEEEKKKFRSEIHVVSSTSSSSRNNAAFAGSNTRRFESTVVFPPQPSRGYGEYGFHGRTEQSMSIPTVQSWNRTSYPPAHQSKPYQNDNFRSPYNSSRKY